MTFNEYVITEELGSLESNRSFKELTSIGCGGKIRTLYTPKDIEALRKSFQYIIKHQLRYFILGTGTNVLASDDFFDGIVIYLKKMNPQFTIQNDILECSAFYSTMKLAYELASQNYGDLSFLGGIPGLLGGAIYNNSGAYCDDISKHLIDVTYINSAGEIETIANDSCAFSYRRSIFHYLDAIILSARFRVTSVATQDILEKRKRERQLSQPLDNKSLGSIFKNNPLICAWKVVDALGLRGCQIGGAAVSAKHSNFIINLGNATTKDVNTLIELIQKRSELEFGIKLICEISHV